MIELALIISGIVCCVVGILKGQGVPPVFVLCVLSAMFFLQIINIFKRGKS